MKNESRDTGYEHGIIIFMILCLSSRIIKSSLSEKAGAKQSGQTVLPCFTVEPGTAPDLEGNLTWPTMYVGSYVPSKPTAAAVTR